jgi:hypothetical protein
LTSIDWQYFWNLGTFILSSSVALRLILSEKKINISNKSIYIISFIIITYFIFQPIQIYSDKWIYKENFENIINLTNDRISDYGYHFLNLISSFLFESFEILLFIIGVIYLTGYIVFIKKKIPSGFRFIAFLVAVSSLGFYGYGTNTIRQGLGLSLFLIAIANDGKKHLFYLFLVLSILFHKSLLIPVIVILFTKKFPSINKYYFLWFLCLIISLLFKNIIVDNLSEYLVGNDKFDSYFFEDTKRYKSGFRIDFLIYSLIPLLYGRYVLNKIDDKVYRSLLSMYIVVNAIWLLMIRIPFTDRFAYLSWFLIPFIFLYPLSKYKIFKHQNLVVSTIIIYIASVNFIVN